MEAEVSDPSSEDDIIQGHIRAPSQRGKAEDSLEPKQRSGVGILASGCQCNDGTEGYPESGFWNPTST
jgi:hypothetical protein